MFSDAFAIRLGFAIGKLARSVKETIDGNGRPMLAVEANRDNRVTRGSANRCRLAELQLAWAGQAAWIIAYLSGPVTFLQSTV